MIREPIKNYLADFFHKGGRGVLPNSTEEIFCYKAGIFGQKTSILGLFCFISGKNLLGFSV